MTPADHEHGPGPTAPARGEPEHRAGFVAIVGRPNVGKSTLLNALVGEELAVATAHPQTTRERLLGIWTEPGFQVVLVDTPGIHRARSALNRFMVEQAVRAARDVDLVLLLSDVPAVRDEAAASSWEPGPVALEVLTTLRELGRPIVLVLTKADLVPSASLLLPIIDRWRSLHRFEAIVPVSALRRQGLDVLAREIIARMPVHPAWFPPDQMTDKDLRWHARELVRAELFRHLREELPYSAAVTVESYRELADRDRVRATIHVERDSQKGMVVGKGGQTIRAISMAARQRISRLTGRPCELFLAVTVTKNWTKEPSKLSQLGYDEPEDA